MAQIDLTEVGDFRCAQLATIDVLSQCPHVQEFVGADDAAAALCRIHEVMLPPPGRSNNDLDGIDEYDRDELEDLHPCLIVQVDPDTGVRWNMYGVQEYESSGDVLIYLQRLVVLTDANRQQNYVEMQNALGQVAGDLLDRGHVGGGLAIRTITGTGPEEFEPDEQTDLGHVMQCLLRVGWT